MSAETREVLLVSDFNIQLLANFLQKQDSALTANVSPYGQVAQILLGSADEPGSDAAVVWTRPEVQVRAFADLLEGRPADLEAALAEVDLFAGQLRAFAAKKAAVLVPTWTLARWRRGAGLLDFRKEIGLRNTLCRMNLRLAEALEPCPNAYVLDAQRWTEAVGATAHDARLWYTTKIPFDMRVFEAAAEDIVTHLAALRGASKKLIVVDLDNTLWGGTVGDLGPDKIRLGGHDPIGEAFVAFQKALASLARRGVVLAIASKNEEEVALKAIREHPEMALRPDDFVAWRINWNDKAQNIVELCQELNLGLDSAVFIDDNPAERARVAEQLPAVLVPDWPKNPMAYEETLLKMPCFDSAVSSREDSQRTRMYRDEKARQSAMSAVGSLDDWLRTLELSVRVRPLAAEDEERAVQLLNKTNQMNLKTRRMTREELLAWIEESNRRLWTFRVQDRFGDSGLTGLLSVEVDGETLSIVDFVLSCRVFGRQIENVMVHEAVSHAREQGCQAVRADLVPTPKNKPCRDFWSKSGFETNGSPDTFVWNAEADYAPPPFVTIQRG